MTQAKHRLNLPFRLERLNGDIPWSLRMGNSNRLSPKIYQFIRPEFDCISEGLGRLLGEDLSGPYWVLCTCRDCQRREAESDHTALPGRNPLDNVQVEEIVKAVTAKRKY